MYIASLLYVKNSQKAQMQNGQNAKNEQKSKQNDLHGCATVLELEQQSKMLCKE